ncbi:hypothetical protein [Neolewinella antarctica]|uniref:Uncharacterized protein n=1 Tax=Neolewinella antarctica TaxID=442734 RepID=A0ABX0XGP5_9BACT|nr:hypothetical protein [Neolewinella antarctica]NJC28048.1 hypothetical protein [Neolewinella antarctica]
MNPFVTFELVLRTENASLYTPRYGDETGTNGDPEYKKFRDKAKLLPDQADRFAEIEAQIAKLAKRGTRSYRLRPENGAFALPAKHRPLMVSVDCAKGLGLRLYCLLLPDDVIILCNGGLKTTNDVIHCPNVSQYFREANQILALLNEQLAGEQKPLTFTVIEEIIENETFYL